MRRETSQEIDSRAAEWAARIDRGALSSEEDRQLEQWLAGDQRRRGAFMRIRAVALHSERARALGSGYDPDAFLDRPLAGAAAITRRRMLWLGGSAVAAAMIGAVGLRLTGATRYGTRLGEVRVVTLKDGSVITLNTSSSIRVDMGSARRLVALEAGEALFDVASDPARPFIVEAGDAAVRAVGTSFAVRRFGSAPVEVVVREGLVEVTAPSNARPIRMGANSRLVAAGTGPMGVPARLQPDAISRELAWKDGRLAFEGEALGRAAQSFARYSDIRIVIDDPAVAREEITGLFAANDPVSFARAAALSLDLSVTVNSGEVRLQRRPIS